jgi:hypothetical protein
VVLCRAVVLRAGWSSGSWVGWFRCTGRGMDLCADVPNPAPYPRGCEPLRLDRLLPEGASGRWPVAGKDGGGCARRSSAKSSGRPGRGRGASVVVQPRVCLNSRTGFVPPPLGRLVGLQPDDGADDDRQWPFAVGPGRSSGQPRVQSALRLRGRRSVEAGIGRRRDYVSGAPCGRVAEHELATMLGWPTIGARRTRWHRLAQDAA